MIPDYKNSQQLQEFHQQKKKKGIFLFFHKFDKEFRESYNA